MFQKVTSPRSDSNQAPNGRLAFDNGSLGVIRVVNFQAPGEYLNPCLPGTGDPVSDLPARALLSFDQHHSTMAAAKAFRVQAGAPILPSSGCFCVLN